MEKKKGLICLLILACLFLLLYINYFNKTSSLEPFNYASGDTYIAMTADSYIFMQMDSGKTTYYRQYLYEDNCIEIGEIDNFFLSTKGSAVVGQSVFFIAVVIVDEQLKTLLYEIDLTKNSLSAVVSDYACNFDAYTFAYKDYVAIAKYYYESDNIRSCIDLYDPISKKIKTVLTANIDNVNLIGSIFLKACSDGENIYVLTDVGNGLGQNPTTNIVEYDSTFKPVRSLSIEKVHDYIMESRVYEMTIENNYIFLSNYSNNSVICKLKKDEVIPIIQQQDLEIVERATDVLLYVRGSGSLFMLEPTTAQIKKIETELKNNFVIKCLLACDNKVLMIMKADGAPDYIVLTNIKKIEKL